MRELNLIVVHCSATPAKMDIGADTIRKWHKDKGWSDIGYHYVIKRNGTIELGRPVERMGAHVRGYNKNSIGICMVGGEYDGDAKDDHSFPENNFNLVQFESLRELVNDIEVDYGVTEICGHRDLSPDKNNDGEVTIDEWLKVCPCFDVKEMFKSKKAGPGIQGKLPLEYK